MEIRIISDIKQFKQIQDDWNILFNLGGYSVFQSFEFNYYSWKTELSKNKQNILCIIEVRSKDILSAIFPLYIDCRKRLRFLNDKHADFCDFLINDYCDFDMILSYARKKRLYNSVHFINLKDDSFVYNFYKKRDVNNSFIKDSVKYSDLVLSEGSFPDNYDKYKSKNKSVFRRVKRKNNNKSHYLLSKDKDDFPIMEVNVLKERMIKLGLRSPNFLDNNRLRLLEKLFNSDKLIISIIRQDMKIHALSFILKNSDNYLFWISLFDNSQMIHIYNYILFMEAVSGNNKVQISFGRGDYDYKITFFKTDVKQLFAIFIFINQFDKLIFWFFDKMSNIIKQIYKSILR